MVAEVASASDSTAQLVGNITRRLARVMRQSGYEAGCPIATVALETVPRSAGLQDECRAALRSWRRLFADALRSDGADHVTAEDLALLIVAAIEGALILTRVESRADALVTVGRELGSLIEQRLTPLGRRPKRA